MQLLKVTRVPLVVFTLLVGLIMTSSAFAASPAPKQAAKQTNYKLISSHMQAAGGGCDHGEAYASFADD